MLDEALRVERRGVGCGSQLRQSLVDRLVAPLDEAVRVEDQRRFNRKLDDALRVLGLGDGSQWEPSPTFEIGRASVRVDREGRRMPG